MMPVHDRATIDDFLAQKRLGFVGVSRNPSDFSRLLFAELAARGYDLVPVNPNATEIEQRKCYARITEIEPGLDGALILSNVSEVDRVVQDCATAGIRRVWLYGAGGQGTVTPSAVEFCRKNGISVVAGECPFMFLPDTQWYHRAHGLVRKILGTFPK